MPNDVYFYQPEDFERTDQSPEGMVVVYEASMDIGLHFPLHPAISHLLAEWRLAPAQIMPNGWSYILVTITVLEQVGLYCLPTPMEVNYLWSLIAQPSQEGHYALNN